MGTHFFVRSEDFLRQGSDDSCGQCLRHDPEKENGGGENGNYSFAEYVTSGSEPDWHLRRVISDRIRRFVHKDHFEDDQVIIEGDETAEERNCHQPEQSVICSGVKSHAEQIK